MRNFKKAYKLKVISILVAVMFLLQSTVYAIDLARETYLRKPLLFNQNVSDDKAIRAGKAKEEFVGHQHKKSEKLKKIALMIGMPTLVMPLIGYLGLRYGHDISIEDVLTAPKPQSVVRLQDKEIRVDSRLFISPDKLKTQIDVGPKLRESNQKFWSEIFMNYPDDAPVSGVITLDVIRKVWKNKQLDDLFNALRLTRPDLAYRYLSEIPYTDMDEFAMYFATLKPGTRQQIFEIFYKRLRKDFLVLENAKIIKSILYPNDYATLSEQAHRMQKLYARMSQMLNRIYPLGIGEIREGPLEVHDLPEGPVAPLPIFSLTREQSELNMYDMVLATIDKYKNQGYQIVLPYPRNVNVSETAQLIGYFIKSIVEREGIASTFLEDNQSSNLLQWVREQTNPLNPNAHRVTEQELFDRAMQLHVNKKNNTIDLFKVIATVGHYYKAMARSPMLILGGSEARAGEDGTDYIWYHHDPMHLTWVLDPEGNMSVDDQGRPVMHWRPVGENGNNWIPKDQKTGILRFSTEDDSYHSWNIILMSLYVSAKSLDDLKRDFENSIDRNEGFYREYKVHRFSNGDVSVGEFFKRGLTDNSFKSMDTIKLPIFYKYAQKLRLENIAWERKDFSITGRIRSKERAKAVLSKVGTMLYRKALLLQQRVEFRDIEEPIISYCSNRTIEGGRTAVLYFDGLVKELEELRKNRSLNSTKRLSEILEGLEQLIELRYFDSEETNLDFQAIQRVYNTVLEELKKRQVSSSLCIMINTGL